MRRIAIVGARPFKEPLYQLLGGVDAPEREAMRKATYIKNYAIYKLILNEVALLISSLDRLIDYELVSGGAEGVDSTAEYLWEETAWSRSKTIYLPDYAKYSPREAPLERNKLIAQHCDELHAYPAPWSRGTNHAIRCAKDIGKPVTIHETWRNES